MEFLKDKDGKEYFVIRSLGLQDEPFSIKLSLGFPYEMDGFGFDIASDFDCITRFHVDAQGNFLIEGKYPRHGIFRINVYGKKKVV